MDRVRRGTKRIEELNTEIKKLSDQVKTASIKQAQKIQMHIEDLRKLKGSVKKLNQMFQQMITKWMQTHAETDVKKTDNDLQNIFSADNELELAFAPNKLQPLKDDDEIVFDAEPSKSPY